MIFDKSLFALGVDGGSKEPPIYLDRNGITIKAAEWAEEGEFYTLSLGEGLPEETYYVWPKTWYHNVNSLQKAIDNTYNKITDTVLIPDGSGVRIKLGNVVTSKLERLDYMFHIKMPNEDSGVSRWDVSNVTGIDWFLNALYERVKIPNIEYWNPEKCKTITRSFELNDQNRRDLSRWRLPEGVQIDSDSFIGWPDVMKPRIGGPKFGTLQVELESGERIFVEELNKPVKGVKAVLEGSIARIQSDTYKVSKIIDWLYIGGAENSANRIELAVSGASELTEVPNYLPSWVTSLNRLFYMFSSLDCDLDMWLTNKVKDFTHAFGLCRKFNGKGVETFNMYSAVVLDSMMHTCVSWNPSKIEWVPHRAKSTTRMFWSCFLFNPDISKLHLPVCSNAQYMFSGCRGFNQPVEHIFSQELERLDLAFSSATSFNQPLSNLPTRNVTNMDFMLRNASSFNQDLSGMCVPKITEMPSNFDTGATSWTLPRPVWGTCPNG